FDTVVVACAHRAWQETLLAQMRQWFPEVTVMGTGGGAVEAPRGTKAIVVLGSHVDAISSAWQAVRASYVDAIVLSERGPLHPQRRGDALHVTALAAAKLRVALGACGTCDSRLDGGAALAQSLHPQARVEPAHAVRVLAVDDSPVNLTLLVDQLQTLGYTQIDRAADGSEALACCLRQPYDVIVADLCMPQMDGHALLAALREIGIATPVIANTAASCDAVKAKVEGFFDVLRKPVSIGRLRAVLEDVFASSTRAISLPSPTLTPTPTHTAALAQALREAFAASWPEDEAALRQAVKHADADAMQRALHRVGGALAVLGEREANCRCAVLHELVRALGVEAIATQVEPFLQTLSQIAARPCNSDEPS
ncbi:MAG TPA: response regulator, partial [Trinickia sp.]|nr:response regulator [Trinickia sp.]